MIGIIFIGDLKYCPYLNRYTESLEKSNTKYEVLYWNREGSNNKYPENYIGYVKKSKLNKNIYRKFSDFIGYKLWLNRKLKNTKYDRLIVLSTLSGIISFEFLVNKYKNKYIFDIRDYSYEHNRIFYLIEKKIIEKSYFTCVSSEGFKNFLPQDQTYLSVHNFNAKDIHNTVNFSKKNKGQRLNLVWMGAVRYFNHQKKIIDKLKNDPRFNLIYHGSGADLEEYIKYCNYNEMKNVVFTGEYSNEQKRNLIAEADIINNSYMTSKKMEVKYAISNKYYDGILYKVPQLVESDTYKATKVQTNGLGIAVDPDDNDFADKIYDYYHNIDVEKFNAKCKTEINKIVEEDKHYTQEVNRFLSDNI